MESKKSPKADLENKKPIFMLIAIIVTLTGTLIALELQWTDMNISTIQLTEESKSIEEMAPITRQEEVKPPPPAPRVNDVLVIVENSVVIENQTDINSEMTENTVIEPVTNTTITIEEEEEETAVFYIVEEMPVFPGGQDALSKFIAQSIRYPQVAIDNNIEGRVFVSFVIGPSGKAENIKIARSLDASLDREALRVINSMPTWQPGKQRGKPVKVAFTVPITFKLQY